MATEPELKQYIPVKTAIIFFALLAFLCSILYATTIEPRGIRVEEVGEETVTSLREQFATRPVGTVLLLLFSVALIVSTLCLLWFIARLCTT